MRLIQLQARQACRRAVSLHTATTDTLTFAGERKDDGSNIVQVLDARGPKPLPARLDLKTHACTGFEWGYVGAGPAQLALAICASIMARRLALQTYLAVEAKLIAPISTDSWTLTAQQVLAVVRADQSRLRRWP